MNKKKVFKDMLIWARNFFPKNNEKKNETTKTPSQELLRVAETDYIIFPQKIRRLQEVLPQAQATDNGRQEEVMDTYVLTVSDFDWSSTKQ